MTTYYRNVLWICPMKPSYLLTPLLLAHEIGSKPYYWVFTFYIVFSVSVFETSRGAAARIVTVKSTGCEFDPHSRRRNIYLLARRWVLPLNTQCLQNSADSGERSVLTLGSLCLPSCVRYTAWSWFDFFDVMSNRKSLFLDFL